jgi:serine/threonine-protein kinase
MTQKDGDDAFSVVIDEPSTKNEISGPRPAAPGPVTGVGEGAVLMQSQVLQRAHPDAPTQVGRDTATHAAPAQQPRGGLGKLGRYTLLSRLGKGGMAEVFLATQDGPAGFQKQVVIKKSDPELAKNPRFVEMFLREAKIAALLNHSNVVQVFELGQEGDTYFIAMEHIDGISLHKAARRAWSIGESIPMEVVVKCVADAARGLHYAHTWRDRSGNLQGFIHRDISPDNLMVTRDGVTKVLDFGIAKMAIDDAEPVTKTGEIKGKIPYMSPEQLKGELLDGRADLWSLGVTLYWLLTGARPFAGGNEIATLQAILHETPLPPRQVNPLVPVPLERLTLRLLEKDRNKRFASGADVADALLTLLGPGAGSNAASDFALKMLALEDADGAQIRTSNPGSQSVQTVVAAKPQTEWLMKQAPVDASDDAEWRGTITGARRPDLSAPHAPGGPATPVSTSVAEGAFADATAQLPAPANKGGMLGIAAGAAFVLLAAIAIVATALFVLHVVACPITWARSLIRRDQATQLTASAA